MTAPYRRTRRPLVGWLKLSAREKAEIRADRVGGYDDSRQARTVALTAIEIPRFLQIASKFIDNWGLERFNCGA